MSHFKGPEVNRLMFPIDISVFKIFVLALKKNGNNTALVDGRSGASVSFSEMFQHSSSLATGLQRAGVAVGDPVVLCSQLNIPALETLLGVMLSGATPVVIPEHGADKIDRLTKGHAVKAVLYDSAYADQVKESVTRMTPPPTLVTTVFPDDPVMATLLEASPHELEEYHLEDPKNHIYVVLCSSGSTGDPKGVPAVDLRDTVQHDDIQFRRSGPVLTACPMHMASLFFDFVSCIMFNYTLILSDLKNPKHNLHLLEKYKVKGWSEETSTLNLYVKEACPHQFDLSSLDYFSHAGDIMYSSVASQFFDQVLHNRDVKVFQSYGSTDIGCLTQLWTKASELPTLGMGASGKVNPGCELKIVDFDGTATVEVGVVGEIWAKSLTMNVSSGYWGRPELDPPIDKDGFLHTGDVALFDQHGFLYTRGRLVDLIDYRGLKFSGAEVVNELLWHPDIADAAVVGIPHPDDGQHPRAFVALRPGASVSQEDIVAFVADKVQDHMRLRGGVRIVEKLPRSNCKIDRPLLRKLADTLE